MSTNTVTVIKLTIVAELTCELIEKYRIELNSIYKCTDVGDT